MHYSCFIRDQFYPGIRDKNDKRRGRALTIVGEVVSGKKFVCRARGLEDVSELYPGDFAKFFRIEV